METNKNVGFRIGHRLIVLIMVSSVSLLIVGGFSINNLRNDLFDQKQLELKHIIQSAVHIADSYYSRAQGGEFAEEEAKVRALKAINAIRYGEGDYLCQ